MFINSSFCQIKPNSSGATQSLRRNATPYFGATPKFPKKTRGACPEKKRLCGRHGTKCESIKGRIE